jgi:bacterioferritin
VPEIFECDLRLEPEAIPRPLRKRARLVTRDLSATILEGEEEHVETLETHLGLLAKIGLENYIQLQSGPAS